jgi:transglutaminase-like putative cysteine protease
VRLRIVHKTTYRYRRQVLFNPHRLVLLPRAGPDLRVLDHSLEVVPAAQLVWAQDIFGNLVTTAAVSEAANELMITSTSDVETTAPLWPIFHVDPRAHAYPFQYTVDEAIDLGALADRQGADLAVAAWAASLVHSDPTDTLSLLKDLNAAVLSAVVYRPRDEEGTQSAEETLRIRSGSCRDLADLFIEASRSLGFGARAISGYLFDPETPSRHSDTTHGWAEVYLPGAGWIAFDPTHGRVGGGGLIAIGVGRCNAQIMPVEGSYVGAPDDFVGMDVDVEVQELEDAPVSRASRAV